MNKYQSRFILTLLVLGLVFLWAGCGEDDGTNNNDGPRTSGLLGLGVFSGSGNGLGASSGSGNGLGTPTNSSGRSNNDTVGAGGEVGDEGGGAGRESDGVGLGQSSGGREQGSGGGIGIGEPTGGGGGGVGLGGGVCDEACSRIISCFVETGDVQVSEIEEFLPECVQGCAAASPNEVQCVVNLSCNEILSGNLCQTDNTQNSSNGSSSNGVQSSSNGATTNPSNSCDQVCAKLNDCGVPLSGSECAQLCETQSENISCVLNNSCNDILSGACGGG